MFSRSWAKVQLRNDTKGSTRDRHAGKLLQVQLHLWGTGQENKWAGKRIEDKYLEGKKKKKKGERQRQFPLCKPPAVATRYSSAVQPSVSLAANLRCTWCAFKPSLAQRFWVERNRIVHFYMKLTYICFRGEENTHHNTHHLFEGESFCWIVIGTHNGHKSIRAVVSDISSSTSLDLFCGV